MSVELVLASGAKKRFKKMIKYKSERQKQLSGYYRPIYILTASRRCSFGVSPVHDVKVGRSDKSRVLLPMGAADVVLVSWRRADCPVEIMRRHAYQRWT